MDLHAIMNGAVACCSACLVGKRLPLICFVVELFSANLGGLNHSDETRASLTHSTGTDPGAVLAN